MFCNQCGKPLPEDAAFCPECGAVREKEPEAKRKCGKNRTGTGFYSDAEYGI